MAMYDPEPLVRMLEQLRVERNESYREASLNAGLDHEAMRRYCIHKKRPQMQSLIALADHFGVNPNQLLELAGYLPLAIFERAEIDPESVPSDVKELMDDLARIADPALRKQVIEAVRVLIGGYLESLEPT